MTRLRTAAVLALLGGGLAWTAQLWLNYLLGDVLCRSNGAAALAGIGVDVMWYAVSAISALVGLVAVLLGIATWRGTSATGEATAALRWVSLIGAAASAVFLGAIVLGAIAPLMVPCAA